MRFVQLELENFGAYGEKQIFQLDGQNSKKNIILIGGKNGFEIAEKDLEIRGAGDFFGTNQSGIPVWRFFKPSIDRKLIIESKEASEKLVKDYDINKEKIDFLREVFYRNENFMNYFSV